MYAPLPLPSSLAGLHIFFFRQRQAKNNNATHLYRPSLESANAPYLKKKKRYYRYVSPHRLVNRDNIGKIQYMHAYTIILHSIRIIRLLKSPS